jgi:hypothetical protein
MSENLNHLEIITSQKKDVLDELTLYINYIEKNKNKTNKKTKQTKTKQTKQTNKKPELLFVETLMARLNYLVK